MSEAPATRRPAPTFLGVPYRPLAALGRGDVVVIGAPHGTPYPETDDVGYDLTTASDIAPAAIRKAAVQSSSDIDHWDFDLDGPLLADGARALVDAGDLPTVAGDGPGNRALIAAATAAVTAVGALPVLIGGDDSVPIPFHRALAAAEPFAMLQVDAHIDWRDAIGGERDGYSSTMRRASELAGVKAMVQVGMRGVGSARREEVEAARRWGARIVTAAAFRADGAEAVLASLPEALPVVIAVDCDAFDPSVCPAVNAPAPGGLFFHEIAGLVGLVAARRRILGLSIVELVPAKDPHAISATVAARLALNVVGAVVRRG